MRIWKQNYGKGAGVYVEARRACECGVYGCVGGVWVGGLGCVGGVFSVCVCGVWMGVERLHCLA